MISIKHLLFTLSVIGFSSACFLFYIETLHRELAFSARIEERTKLEIMRVANSCELGVRTTIVNGQLQYLCVTVDLEEFLLENLPVYCPVYLDSINQNGNIY